MNASRAASVLLAALFACSGPRDKSEAAPSERSARASTNEGRSAGAPTPAARAELGGRKTIAVISGVLSWKDSSLSSFPPKNRKDRELHAVLTGERGVPAESATLLLDEAASTPEILAALRRAVKSATSATTLVFYYAGHGLRADDGSVIFASADIDSAKPKDTGLGMDQLERALEGMPAGSEVMLLGDCCYSGAMRDVAASLAKRGIRAVSLTSSDSSNLSSGNWTFTQSLIDALRGDSLSDRDGDGAVELEELRAEAADAMKFREHQLSGFANHGFDMGTVLSKATPGPSFGATASGHKLGDYVRVTHDGRLQPARIRGGNRGGVVARLYHYSDALDVTLDPAAAQPIVFQVYPKDTRLSVWWGKKLYDARVTAVEGDFLRITYPGWASYWDEWILSDRVESEARPR